MTSSSVSGAETSERRRARGGSVTAEPESRQGDRFEKKKLLRSTPGRTACDSRSSRENTHTTYLLSEPVVEHNLNHRGVDTKLKLQIWKRLANRKFVVVYCIQDDVLRGVLNALRARNIPHERARYHMGEAWTYTTPAKMAKNRALACVVCLSVSLSLCLSVSLSLCLSVCARPT